MAVEQNDGIGTTASPMVAIVGRPNVGKSTLFNRICRTRQALVDDTPGITRDRMISHVTWAGSSFCLVDTGGIEEGEGETPIKMGARQQAQIAVDEADVVLFLADGKEGLHSGDATVVDLLRRSDKPVLFAVNKIDGPEQEDAAYEFYGLGVENLFPISAAHGYGIRDMMDALLEMLPRETVDEEMGKGIRVAVIGRPNVGKSSLVNRILGSERVLVSDMPGTTRDVIDVSFTLSDKSYVLIDTPGIRRRSKTREKIEKFSVLKALKSIDRCQVAVLLVDAAEGITSQDVRIAGYIHERRRGAVVVINKWDLMEGELKKIKQISDSLSHSLKFMPYAPRLRLSALTGKRVSRLLPTISDVFSQYSTRVTTAGLNETLAEAVSRHEPPMYGRGRVKIFYGTQVAIQPPTFILFANHPGAIHFSYERYLTNRIREAFSLNLTPLRLVFRRRSGRTRQRKR
ncbi:MAG: ribosome biogenesis GTPase Der [Deltaproteobacteria bacterium]|nr:MAG: ribosome biogenesis GTPase Der [Deltaproteobacteria bacterium]